MTVQWRFWLGFGTTLMFFTIALVIGNYTSKQIRLSEQWVTHTHEVLTVLEAVTSEIKDAETGQRGHLLTSKETYLEPYNSALSNAPIRL